MFIFNELFLVNLIYVEPSSSDVKLHQRVNSYNTRPALHIQKRRNGAHHDFDIYVFFNMFPPGVHLSI